MIAARIAFPIACMLLAACDNGISLEACDIRQSACQEDVFLAVQRVRGNGWDPWLDMPPMRVITQDQLRAELQASYDAAADPDAPFDHMGAALELLLLVAPSETSSPDAAIDAQVSNVAAYYDSARKDVTIVDRGDVMASHSQIFTLAHELVHAAQDRDMGLREWHRASSISNSELRSALTEGEAMLYANLVLAELRDVDPEQIDFVGYHRRMLDVTRQQIGASTSPWYETFGLVYPLGSRYLTDTWMAGGNVAVRALFEQPPVDVVQVFSSPGSRIDRPWPAPCDWPAAPAGFEVLRSTSMGAVELFGFATRLPLESVAWDLAAGWRGDRLTVYGNNDTEDTALVWQIKLERAAELAPAVTALFGAEAVIREDDQVRVMLTTAPEPLDWPDWSACVRE